MLKLVTFNIRCDYDQDGANSFRFRKPVILKKRVLLFLSGLINLFLQKLYIAMIL